MERYGFRVVTPEMKSLGLRQNPNILSYPETGEIFRLPNDWLEEGKGDWGGIWVTKNFSRAKYLVRLMKEVHQTNNCRVFVAKVGRILYENSYRIKTNSIQLLAEVIFEYADILPYSGTGPRKQGVRLPKVV